MIDIKELRIGNYYQWLPIASMGYGVRQILNGADIDRYSIFRDPIPLTEEWLLKFGFDDKRCIVINLDSSSKYLQVTSQNDVLIYDENDDFISLKPIQFVHQLQNLYFTLTGAELEIK